MSEAKSTTDCMPSLPQLCITEPECETLCFTWKNENLELLVNNSSNLDSTYFDVYPECCKIYFSMTLQGLFCSDRTLKIRTLCGPGSNVDDHLKKHHKVQKISWDQYIVGREGARLYAQTKSCLNQCELEIHFEGAQLEDGIFSEPGVLEFRTELKLIYVQNYYRSTIEPLKPLGDLFVNLGHLLETKAFCDFTIKTAGESFPVHRAILAARSPVFEAMFSAGMKESKNNLVELDEIDAESMRIFLRYIYTDKLEFGESTDVNLKLTIFRMADQYQIPRLRALSELLLIKSLSKETVCEILKFADTYCAKYLRYNGLVHVKLNKTALAGQEDFLSLIAHSKELGRDVVKAISNIRIATPYDEES